MSSIDPKTMKLLIIANVIIWVGAIAAFPVLLARNKAKAAGKLDVVKQQKIHNKFIKYRTNVFTRARFREIERIYATFACYDVNQIESECVKVFEGAVKASVAIPIIAGLAMRDILMFALACLVGYIYYNISVSKASDKINEKIHTELAVCVQSIRDKYKECDNIPKAVLDCDKGTMLERPITEIYEILTDKQGQERLDRFCALSPIRLIKTLATCCFIVNETGDHSDATTDSSFAEDLINIRQEVDAEVRRLFNIRIAFKSLPIIALLGIFIMPIEEWYLLNQIPGTSKLIKGTYGMILKVLIVVITAVAYYAISIIMRPSVVAESDRGKFIDQQLLNRKFKQFIKDLLPKDQKTIDKVMGKINGALSQKDMYYVYASKVFYGALGFCFTFVFTVLFVILTRSYMYHNYKPLNFTAQTPMKEELYLQVVAMDAEYMEYDEPLEDEELLKFCKGRLRGLKELELMTQRDRLAEKYRIYKGMVWTWKWGLLPIIASIVCWFIPEFVLMFRKSLVQYEATEDVMQLQTMAIILSATDMDVFKGLFWMEKQSSVHKEIIRYCYHEYTSDPLGALDNLKEKTDNVEFRKIINKFKSASVRLSLADAFYDMKFDKQQAMYMRDAKQAENLESKKQNAKLACVVPGGLALIGLFVLPIIILGFTQLTSSLGGLAGMG